ncbi:MAG: SpoIIE family protein phosphatase [Bacteroidota bacterium]
MPIASITSIYAHEDGQVYLGTDGVGLYSFDGEDFEEVVNTSESNHHITSISSNKEGLLFASKYRGIYQLTKSGSKLISARTSVKGDWMKVYAFGRSLFYANARAFFVHENGVQRKICSFPAEVTIYQIVELKHGILIFSSKGNYYLDSKTRTLKSISKWYNKKGSLNQMSFGFAKGNRVVLYSKNLDTRLEIVLTDKDKVFSCKELKMSSVSTNFPEIKSAAHNPVLNRTYFITFDDKLLMSDGKAILPVELNFEQSLKNCNSIRADINGNIWCASSSQGLYKISVEPFSRILTHKEFKRPDIFSVTKFNNDLLFSSLEGKTYISRFRDSRLIEFDFRTGYTTQDDEFVWLGTSNGIKKINKQTYEVANFSIKGVDGENILLVELFGKTLYIGIYGKGIRKYDLSTKQLSDPQKSTQSALYFYTFQHSQILQKNYFGTNNCIYEEDLSTGIVNRVSGLNDMGYFSGVSTKDSYGNIWFTCDNGLIGILKNGEIVKLTKKEYFNSTLFYTLNSDSYGNLIIGTNKGLTLLKLNEFGRVLSVHAYTNKNGFEGYETNMRAQFQNSKEIIVATVEGLFSLDTRLLENLPKPTAPVIKEVLQRYENQSNSLHAFKISSNNPKIKSVKYIYRIIGKDNNWSAAVQNPTVYIDNLENGSYTIEAKATYDGKVYSDVTSYDFEIRLAIWKSRWFIFLALGLVLLMAFFAISQRKSIEGVNFFITDELLVELREAPSILLFSFLANFGINLFVLTIDPTLPNLIPLAFVTSFLMLINYILVKIAKATGRNEFIRPLLIATFSIFVTQSYIGLYFSNLHYFYVVGIAMINTIAPYVYQKFNHVVIHNLVMILVTSTLFIILEDLSYHKYIFLVTLLVSAVLSIFLTYLRYDSIEKLLFISGIVNNGKVPVLVFNKTGKITFVSNNIEQFLPVTRLEMMDKKVSYLNQFLMDGDDLKSIDFTKMFIDDSKYTARMTSNLHETIWIEWTCKVFADNINCIIGQDVSDRIEAESTYELLVESAEDLIYHTEINGIISFSNDRFKQFFGYNPNTDRDSTSQKYVHPDYVETVWKFYEDHFKQKKVSSYFEFQVIDANGKTKWLGQHVSSRIDPHNPKHIVGFLVVARDITKNLENEKLIFEQNREITSSIQYSKQIQQALFTPKEYIETLFEESFLLFKPKDIVSGDFYWFHRTEDKLLFAIGDCTGHGVPGAFMTILGINLLNSIVIDNHYHNPAQILNEMDRRLSNKLFKQNETSINDGIEITVCCIDIETSIMSFACAGSRFLVYNEDDFALYKGDNKHIGDVQEGFLQYMGHRVELKKTDSVYFPTDGYQDQFGGVHDKRFSFRRLLEAIESNALLPLAEQHQLIEEELDNWKGDFEQTDDVTIFAFKGVKV